MHKLEILWQLRGIGFGSTRPVFCDLDNDNSIEIITSNISGDIIIVSADDGKIKKRKDLVREKIRDLIVRDVNKDGLLEVIFATEQPSIVFADPDLKEIYYNVALPSLPLRIFATDIDNDHLPEIIVVDVTSSINIIKSGSIMSRLTLDKPIYALDYGKILVGNTTLSGLLVVHNNTVSLYRQNEKLKTVNEKTIPLDILSAKIDDIDGDGVDEVIIASDGNILLINDLSRNAFDSFKIFRENIVSFELSDIDGDGQKEIIAIGQKTINTRLLKVYKIDGEPLAEYQLPLDGSKILVGDINGDNSQEIIVSDASGKELFCLDMKSQLWCKWISEDNFLFINLYDINCDLRDEIVLRTINKLVALRYI